MLALLRQALAVVAVFSAITSNAAWADYVCPADNDPCSHTVQASVGPVDLSGAGRTADSREWIVAPGDKYFVNASVQPEGFTGRNVHCEFGGSDGVQERQIRVGDGTVTVTFAKRFLVVAHAETGSGPSNISHTAMMECNFHSGVAQLPQR
jgi:hypothetical protein